MMVLSRAYHECNIYCDEDSNIHATPQLATEGVTVGEIVIDLIERGFEPEDIIAVKEMTEFSLEALIPLCPYYNRDIEEGEAITRAFTLIVRCELID